ncbi:CRIPT protein, putative [Brugia malayi]|uniref:Cysteine-rich PDZ-binding protein n=1 Tax=Brugia malayi TaxID=6279 RepID=A0A0I9R390_BRUMA|nr:CRIPT protein, putative [Brugia malayi]CTP81742.1 BMA-PGAL-1 [Brugia malayi]VIO96056.1 CRIPT protein, putative [Brugia malayi]
MVCDSCVKKLGKVAAIDPYRTKSRNECAGPIKKGGNENKLLSTRKDRFQPYNQEFRKCRICKTVVHQVGSHYCQQCAYQKAICAMCGKKMADTKKLKMSSV